MVIKYIFCGVLTLLFACILSPIILSICKKMHAEQTILHYVDKHAQKSGTPTMGGMIFLLSLLFSCIFLQNNDNFVAFFAVIVTFGYGILGFLDDFIKVKLHHNEGLKPYQKVIGQVGIAIAVAIFLFTTERTSIQFFSYSVDVGLWIIPLAIFVLVATTNSVNLTDGLDGLAGGVNFVVCLFLGIVLALTGDFENQNLAILCFGLCGAILSFLMINCFPAKIFMGDTGSLSLGGFVGVVALLGEIEFYIPLVGIMFVLSAISDIIQVFWFKRTGRRIFLMAPLHHHFEKRGVHENRIVVVYIVVTVAVSLVTLAGVLLL